MYFITTKCRSVWLWVRCSVDIWSSSKRWRVSSLQSLSVWASALSVPLRNETTGSDIPPHGELLGHVPGVEQWAGDESRWQHSVGLGGKRGAAVPPIGRSPAPLPPSGLKVLVDVRDVLHDALPVRPVRLHQLLYVLSSTDRGVRVTIQEIWDDLLIGVSFPCEHLMWAASSWSHSCGESPPNATQMNVKRFLIRPHRTPFSPISFEQENVDRAAAHRPDPGTTNTSAFFTVDGGTHQGNIRQVANKMLKGMYICFLVNSGFLFTCLCTFIFYFIWCSPFLFHIKYSLSLDNEKPVKTNWCLLRSLFLMGFF